MNSSTSQPTLIERSDVHKSCKSLEVVVNLLNDYCEAAGAIVQLQKKLAKAVRETANMKATPEFAINAFSACAVLLDVLSDVDNKFAKVADKECEALSSEVRKWFKKLAKEEKNHDDRMAQASAKIKQAGLSYEKKAKKNPREAADEHSRYLTLVGTLGPEMTQDKYNHAVFVSQKHSTTTMNVAACLARLTDAEWLRSCENVRRFAPTIGQLGEWRIFCEGGWMGQRPLDLPTDNSLREPSFDQRQADRPNSRNGSRPPSRVDTTSIAGKGETPQESIPSTDHRASLEPTTAPEQPSSSPAVSLVLQREQLAATQGEEQKPVSSFNGSTNPVDPPTSGPESPRRSSGQKRSSTSLASLAAFPSPPTHFPIPAVSTPTGHRSSASLSGQSTPSLVNGGSEMSTRSPLSAPRTPSVSFAAMPRVAESPQPEPSADGVQTPIPESKSPISAYPFPQTSTPAEEHSEEREAPSLTIEELNAKPTANKMVISSDPESTPLTTIEPLSPADTGPARGSSTSGSQSSHGGITLRRGDYLNDREFGAERPLFPTASKSLDAIKGKGVQRADSTNSSGSMVAAMRSKYSHSTSPASPPPRDVPKLTQSVNEIASKYRSPEIASPTPLRRTTSPPADMLTQSRGPSSYRMPDTFPEAAPRTSLSASTSSRNELTSSTSSFVDDFARRRQRIDELEELEFREREFELRQKEREIEHRARELERERAQLASARAGPSLEGYASDELTGRTRADQLPPGAGVPRGRFSSSATPLVMPPSSRTQSTSPAAAPTDHAPYCGCAACSATKYGRTEHAPSPHDLRPPEAPITLRPQADKPKGWMRRLSMPVGVAFSLSDSKKNASPNTNRNSMSFTQEDERVARRGYDTKSPANRSVTNFSRR